MSIGGFRFRRSFGNVEGRRFRGARPISGFSPEAQDYFDRLDAAGDVTYTPYKQPLANYIDSLVALGGGYWDNMASAASFVGVGIQGITVPLRSGMPTLTNNNFVDADLNQVTGLKGNGNTKYMNSNVLNESLGQNDFSLSSYITELPTDTSNRGIMGRANNSNIRTFSSSSLIRCNARGVGDQVSISAGLVGASRSNSSEYIYRVGNANTTKVTVSVAPDLGDIVIFSDTGINTQTNVRLATFHAGASLDLAVLEGLQDTLKAEIAAI